ncbi:hypothetical protein F5Y08DRAFT_3021 [Xylaria arbuscula]|nr:hypothetical protein F5Y08DRAFT_3021 [Xylaria arbuscula]
MQLYLDRVQPMLPILSATTISHLRKDLSSLDQYGRCLRYAVLTIATAFSSQFEDVRDGLYTTTRDMLNKLDLAEDHLDTNRLEPTQAWIFIVFYEFIKTNYRRGWVSAGRLFRHVQMMGLYGVDRGAKPSSDDLDAENPILDEEKRRAFWTAYYLDRIISVSENTPLTLAEEVIYTRLPCPDSDFHNGIVTPQCFLSEAIVSRGLPRYSRIAECAITATICGRTLSHKQTAVVEKAYNSPPTDYAARRDWLERLLDTRLESLRINRSRETVNPDPLTTFSTILTHVAVLYLWHTANLLSPHDQDQTPSLVARGLESAREICRLAKDIEPRGLFSTHTLTPILLSWCTIRLQMYLETECPDLEQAEKDQIEDQIQTCLEVVRKLKTVNNIAIRALEPYKKRRVPPLWVNRCQGNS